MAFIFPIALAQPEYIITKVTFRAKGPGIAESGLPAVGPKSAIEMQPHQDSEY